LRQYLAVTSEDLLNLLAELATVAYQHNPFVFECLGGDVYTFFCTLVKAFEYFGWLAEFNIIP
jgi:hypothetical protein